jgi:hypothetical protein
MYAVLVGVDIASGRHEESLSFLKDHVMPMSKGAPGFVRGTWFGNEETGNGLMIFDSEQSARQMASQVSSSPEDPVQVTYAHVYEVHGEA